MQEVFEKIIEKLEVEADSANDKIMEQETEKDMAYYDGYDDGCSKSIEIVKQAVADYNNGWIPCSERLPEVPEGTEDDDCPEFNVTIKGASRAATLRCSSDGTWFDEFGHVYPVIAWQPLPPVYQPKGE